MHNPSAQLIALQNGDLDDAGDLDNVAAAVFAAAQDGYEIAGTWLGEAMDQLAMAEHDYWQLEWDDGDGNTANAKRRRRRRGE